MPGKIPDPSAHDMLVRRDSFNRNAGIYTAGRPPYPSRVYAFMEEIGALRDGARLLEIGPGTGQATSDLLRHGVTIDAVELGSSLAEQLRARIPDERLQIQLGDIHTIELPERTYDAVVSATTFHWLDVPALLPRLARTLKPGGWLVVWWNVFGDPDSRTSFRDEVFRLFSEWLPLEAHAPSLIPRAMLVEDRQRELTGGGWFGDPHHEIHRWTHRMNAKGAQLLFSTFPVVANLDASSRAGFLEGLARAVEAEGGMVDDPFVTAIYAVRATA